MINHPAAQIIAQNSPPWLGVLIGHVTHDVTLSNIALVMSIVYSAVNIVVHLKKKR